MNFKFQISDFNKRVSNFRSFRFIAVMLIAYCATLTVSAQNGGTQQNLIGKAELLRLQTRGLLLFLVQR